MKAERKDIKCRVMAFIISLVLILNLTGCGSSVPDAVDNKPSESVPTVSETPVTGQETEPVESTPTVSPTEVPQPTLKISDNGKPITDFDEFVNGEWKREQEAKNVKYASAIRDTNRELKIKVIDFLENTDTSVLPEDSGFYKTIMLYRSIIDTDDMPLRINTIKEYLEPVNKVETLEDLYELYGNEEYGLFDNILRFRVEAMGMFNELDFQPLSYTEDYTVLKMEITSPEPTADTEQYLSFIGELEYSREEFNDIIDNALKIGRMLDDYLKNSRQKDYYTREKLAILGLTDIPVISILKNRNMLGAQERIVASEGFVSLMQELYVPENLPALRDFLILNTISYLNIVSVDSTDEDIPEFQNLAYCCIMKACGDVVAEEYMKKCLTDEFYTSLDTLMSEIDEVASTIFQDNIWLSDYGKEKLAEKIRNIYVYKGLNGYTYDLSEFELSDNPVKSIVELYKGYQQFRRGQLAYNSDKRKVVDINVLEYNGFYSPWLNSFILNAGLLCEPNSSPDTPYEERLAGLGFTIAHETSHAFDPDGINFTDYGKYLPFLSDKEQAAYNENVKKLTEYLDGKEAGYGKTVNGVQVINEAFADMLGMQICLKVLSEHENPDYDLFFRSYAKQWALYATEERIDWLLKDTHLPDNLRINCILYQFDEFYEVYDIDENSPYYVKPEDRFKVF